MNYFSNNSVFFSCANEWLPSSRCYTFKPLIKAWIYFNLNWNCFLIVWKFIQKKCVFFPFASMKSNIEEIFVGLNMECLNLMSSTCLYFFFFFSKYVRLWIYCLYLLEKQTKNRIQVYLCPVTLSSMRKVMFTSMVRICENYK